MSGRCGGTGGGAATAAGDNGSAAVSAASSFAFDLNRASYPHLVASLASRLNTLSHQLPLQLVSSSKSLPSHGGRTPSTASLASRRCGGGGGDNDGGGSLGLGDD